MKAALRAAECKARVSQVEHNKKAKQKAEATASAFCLAPSAGLERASPLPIIADHSPEGEAFTRSQCFRYTAERRASLPYGATLRIPLRGSGKHCKSLCRPSGYDPPPIIADHSPEGEALPRSHCFGYIISREPKADRICGLLLVGSPCWARTSDIVINSHALYRLS